MRVIGTSGDDAFAVDSTAATVSFASNSITDHNLTTIQYTDNGGNDSASVNGPLPLTLNVGSGIDTLNVATGSNAIVYIHGDTTGDLVIDGSGHTVVWYI